jgi:hypothetical protein
VGTPPAPSAPAPSASPPIPPHAPRATSTIEPLAPERYKITFTGDADLKQKIELARDLLRHAVPSGDLATIISRALDRLIEKTMRRRFAKTDRPKPSAHSNDSEDATSRHVPHHVRRAVLDRDGLRCAWQGPDGVRCESRAWLEYDHRQARGLGGTHAPVNGRHFCRSHNQLAAEQAFGKSTIARMIARRRERKRPDP